MILKDFIYLKLQISWILQKNVIKYHFINSTAELEDLLTETEAAKKRSGQRVARDPRVAKRKERRKEKQLAARAEQPGGGGDGGGEGDAGSEQRGGPNLSPASYSGRGGARGGARGGTRGGARGGSRGGTRGGSRGDARGGTRGGTRGGARGGGPAARRDDTRGSPSPKKPFRYFHLQQASENSRFEHNSSSAREFSNNSFRCELVAFAFCFD